MRNDLSTYDYIVVGGGSAGCVLANRLSADPDVSVLLIEAGPGDNTYKIHMPAAVKYVLSDPAMNWGYETEPQRNMDGRRLLWPRARVLGGCSSHNAMVFIRGHARDYDHWRQLGCEGWSYADVLPYFKRAETRQCGGDAYRGDAGPMKIKPADNPNPLHHAWVEAGQQAGFPLTADFNGHQQEGVGWFDLNIRNGRRCNTAYAYLHPVRSRANLRIEVNSLVNRVLFERTRARGVELVRGRDLQVAHARREVVLCGGAINSPQLLMLSGVGPADELRGHGIDVVLDLPGVGRNLQDHLDVAVKQECTEPVSLYGANRPHRAAMIGLEWWLFGTGLGATMHMDTGSFLRTLPHLETPDIQHHFIPVFIEDHGMTWPDRHGYQAHVCQLRQESRGYVKLRSADPVEHPVIEPNYLQTEEDRRCMRDGVKVTREILAQPAFDRFRGRAVQPRSDQTSDADIDAFVREYSQTCYHPSGTCAMGTGIHAVVDPAMKVHGVEGLRVVDASVMPTIVGGNLNAPTIMIAEKAADMILGCEPPPAEEVPVAAPAARAPVGPVRGN